MNESQSPLESVMPGLDAEQISRRASTGAVLFAARAVVVRGIGLVAYLVLARLLSPHEFGTLSIGLSLTFLGGFLADAGLGQAFIQRAESPSGDVLGAMAGLQLAVVVVVLLLPLSIWTALSGGSTVSIVSLCYALGLVPVAMRTPVIIRLERQLDFTPSIWTEVTEVACFNILSVSAVLAGAGPIGVAAASAVKAVVGNVVLRWRAPGMSARPSMAFGSLRSALGFGFKTQGQQAVALARDQAINYGTAAVGGLGVLGVWSLTFRIMLLPAVLFESLWRISFPAFARMRDAGRDLRPIIVRSVGIMSVLTPLALIPLVTGAARVLPSAIGPKWSDASDLLPWLCLATAFSIPISTTGNGLLLARGEAGILLRFSIALSAANLIIAFATLPSLGAQGLAIALLASAVVDTILLTRALNSRYDLRLHRFHLPLIAVAAATAVAGHTVAFAIPEVWLGAVAGTSLALLLYLGLAMVIARDLLSDALRMLLKTVRGRGG